MKNAGKLLALLLVALTLSAAVGCSFLPSTSGDGNATKAPAATTAVPTEAAREDDLNEVRALLSLPPVDGGDVMVRRLDTVPVEDTQKTEEGEEE